MKIIILKKRRRTLKKSLLLKNKYHQKKERINSEKANKIEVDFFLNFTKFTKLRTSLILLQISKKNLREFKKNLKFKKKMTKSY